MGSNLGRNGLSNYWRFSHLVAILAVGVAATFVVAEKSPSAQNRDKKSTDPSAPITQDAPVNMQAAANQAYGLRASEVVSLNVNTTPDVTINVPIAMNGREYTLALIPHSVRAPNYKLRAQIADGSYVDVDPGPDRMLRGSLVEAPGSTAAGGMMEDGLHAVIRMPNGERRWIEPLAGKVNGATPDQYVMYRGEDIIHPNGGCGVDAAFLAANPPAIPAGGGGTDGGVVSCAELGVDADFEYYQH